MNLNKKAYEFSFNWIFALIVGVSVIFLAIYTATNLIDTKRTEKDTVRAKEIGILLTPLETGLEQSKLATISLPEGTRLVNNCSTEEPFGKQQLSAFTRSGVGKKWQPISGATSTFRNKYLFSDDELLAEQEIYLFAKPFEFPYKVADIIMAWPDTEKYCFVFSGNAGVQRKIKEELSDIKPTNVSSVTSSSECSEGAITVCFDSTVCEINILTSQKKVLKESQNLYYEESTDVNNKYTLLFAAIFSDPAVYECQIKRIAERASNIATLYSMKSNYLTPKGCGSAPVLPMALSSFKNEADSLSSSQDLNSLYINAIALKSKNENLWPCKVF